VLQALNSIISSGELPTLFTDDELDGLLQVRKLVIVATVAIQCNADMFGTYREQYPQSCSDEKLHKNERVYIFKMEDQKKFVTNCFNRSVCSVVFKCQNKGVGRCFVMGRGLTRVL
jgi:hypothetical protein